MKNDLHPAWKVCIGLAILLFIIIATGSKLLLELQGTLNEIQTQQRNGEERAYISRALSGCMDIINDGEIEITEECLDSRVAAYYPPSICAKLPIQITDCGIRVTVVSEEGAINGN